ncbi:MAG: TIM barrel protein [Chloroflexales bacterium]|nr:TIM barrel protein [Chloroflexales bacterium]
MVKHAFVWWCLTNRGLNDMQILDAGQKAGFEGVEMVPEQYWGEVKQRGLTMVSTQAHGTIASGLNDRSQHARILAETTVQLEKAVKWNIPTLICFSGNRAGRSDLESLPTIIDGLAKIATLAEQAGVDIVLELLNSKVDHHDYQCDRTPFGVACVAPVNSPRIKLLYDAYHMQIMEGDLIRTVQQNHQYFGHYHIAGNPGRFDPDETQEIHHPPLMRAIADTGYNGFVGHEYLPRGDVASSLKASRILLDVK